MGIMYLISVLILLISFILVKKSNNKINIIEFICVSIVTLFCYNTLICYILTFFTIPITLLLLTLINLAFAIAFIITIIRKKEIQQFEMSEIQLFSTGIIGIAVIVVALLNFGFPFNVKYETSDPSLHYLTSKMFAKSNALLANVENDEIYGDLSTRKTTSYVNSGLIMKALCKDLDSIECYNIFVCFGIFVLFLTGISLCCTMQKFANNKEKKLLALVISILCIMGYPLNSFLFGFEYMSMGLLIICTIIGIIEYFEKDVLDSKYTILIITLLNFGIFCSYFMFVPFVYPAIWIYFCIENYIKTKKIITNKLVLTLFITLIIPFVLGYIYHLLPEVYSILIKNNVNTNAVMKYSSHIVNSAFSAPGYIYINIYSNMILLLPLTLYVIIKKTKENKLITIMIMCTVLFIEVLFVGYKLGKVSMYYLSKNYFALWIMFMYCNYKALISFKNKYIPRVLITGYIAILIVYIAFSNTKMEDVLINEDENILSVMEIYGANKTILTKKEPQFNQEEIEILKYAKDNLDYNSQIEIVTDHKAYYWSYPLMDYINNEESLKKYSKGQNKLNLKVYLLPKKINKVDYMVYFKKSNIYNKMKDEMFINSEIIFENSSGGVLKYNK